MYVNYMIFLFEYYVSVLHIIVYMIYFQILITETIYIFKVGNLNIVVNLIEERNCKLKYLIQYAVYIKYLLGILTYEEFNGFTYHYMVQYENNN